MSGLRGLSFNAPHQTSESTIFQCPPSIYHSGRQYYEPKWVTIGPVFSNDWKEDEDMLRCKVCIAGETKKRLGIDEDTLIEEVVEDVQEARGKYAGKIAKTDPELRILLAVDAIFLIAFMKNCEDPKDSSQPGVREYMRLLNERRSHILADLFIIGNQIPMYILVNAMMIVNSSTKEDARTELIKLVRHIAMQCLVFNNIANTENSIVNISIDDCEHVLDYLHKIIVIGEELTSSDGVNISIPGISYLHRYGIKIHTCPPAQRVCGTWFDPSSFSIFLPKITIYANSDVYIRNLIAYEVASNKPPAFASYVFFVSHLMQSVEDVNIMSRRGVLVIHGVDPSYVPCIWREAVEHIAPRVIARYDGILTSIRDSQNNTRKNLTEIRQKSCSSYWVCTSLVVASIITISTVLQTIYTILGYYNAR